MTELSRESAYEQTFGTRHRRSGRPLGSDRSEVLFPGDGAHPLIQKTAARRAQAVVLEENKDRLAVLYAKELRVLAERGVEEVAADLGVDLTPKSGLRS